MTPEQIAEARRLPEQPDDGELEAWRKTADDLLICASPPQATLRRAAHLLQNAYLFASALPDLRTLADAATVAAQEPVGVVGMSAPDQRMLYSLKAVEVVDVPSAPTAFLFKPLPVGTKIYAAQPAQPLKGLTDYQIEEIFDNTSPIGTRQEWRVRVTRALIAADRRLNGLEKQ